MAGRGRGATLPSWMTSADIAVPDNKVTEQPLPAAAVEDVKSSERSGRRSRSRSRDRDDREKDRHREDRHRDREHRGDRDRDRDRDRGDRDRERDRDRDRDRGRDRQREKGRSQDRSTKWRPRKERDCGSNFDVRPPNGVELPPIGVNTPINGIPNAYLSFSTNPLDMLKEPTTAPPEIQQRLQQHQALQTRMDVSAVTRHARRLYAGGIPPTVTEAEVRNFFNEVITRALGPHNRMDGQPVIGVYLNLDKCYAFVELPSVELTNACMQMDGLRWDHYTGPCVLRIRRPNDYRPELVANAPPPPQLDMDYLTRMGVSSPDGPGKIFVGGLPYNLPDDDLKELLGAFGPLKSFHQVREGGIGSLSKGYGFCEYFTKEASDNAVSGLNGLQLGDKTLTVRYATGSNNPQVVPPGQSLAAQLGVNFSSSSSVPAITYPSILAAAPTRVLKLSNMVSANDLASDAEVEDIKEDVRLECSDHGGHVLSVVIPRMKEGYPASAEGYIFVEFANIDGARAAALALNGRKFDNKTVIVQFYDEQAYAHQVFNQ